MEHYPLVSVIVPTYGREEILCDTLRCLFSQNYPRYEIVVVDQTPDHIPSVKDFLIKAKTDGRIKYVHLKTPSSPGARNVGVSAATGEFVILVDDDVLVESDWISAHILAFSSPNIGAVVGRIVYPPKLDWGFRGKPTAVFLRDGTCTAGFGRDVPAYIETGGGGNMSLRRAIFWEIGGYDEQFTGNAFREESDFALRLREARYLIYFEPLAKIVHLKAPIGGHRVSSPDHGRQFRDNMRNDTRFFLKNFPLRDFPLFVRRFWKVLLFPSLRLALRNRRLLDAFSAQLGFLSGILSYLRYPHTVVSETDMP